MKSFIERINAVYDLLISFGVRQIVCKRELNRIIKVSGKNTNPQKLYEWQRKWHKLGNFNKNYYNVYTQYIGEDINIVPDDLLHNIIEPILNPKRHISTYEDKCMFDRILWPIFECYITAPTYIRSICGCIYDNKYNKCDNNILKLIPTDVNKLIVKPSIDSSSGKHITFYVREGSTFIDYKTKEELSISLLRRYYGDDFIVQKVMKQSPFMDKLCKTSVNTVRMAVYRSVISGKTDVINTVIRIGKDGSLIDNAHAGGMFIGVNENGMLGKLCCNQFGENVETFNGVNFAKQKLIVPNYEKIKEFACKIADAIPHHHIIALDIMLDENNNPVLIEYNISAFSVWLFQFTNGSGFGKYTDEIIDYCIKHRQQATRIVVKF